MNKKLVKLFLISAICLLPVTVLAAFDPGQVPFASGQPIVETTNAIINNILGFLWVIFAVFSVIMFILAGMHFMSARGEPGELEKARMFLIWGVAGVVVAVLAFSIPFVIRNALLPAPPPVP